MVIFRIAQYEFGLPVLILATGPFQNLKKKKHKGVIYYSRFSTHFLSFFIFWYYLYQTYGIICDKCQGTSCEVPYVQLKLIERF